MLDCVNVTAQDHLLVAWLLKFLSSSREGYSPPAVHACQERRDVRVQQR